MINIAASAPTVPRMMRVEFSSTAEVESRIGMRSHGRAQLSNDLLTAQPGSRYGMIAIGYGPGSVRTRIRREIPLVIRGLMAPFFHFAHQRPRGGRDATGDDPERSVTGGRACLLLQQGGSSPGG